MQEADYDTFVEELERSTLVSKKVADLKDIPALVNGDPQAKISFSDFKGKWIVLFSYPLDFTFVCPTEIKQFVAQKPLFDKIGVQGILMSTDSTFCHLAWQKEIGECPFPWIADTSLEVSRSFGILKEDQGIAFRGSIIIDPELTIQSVQVNNLTVGRDVEELAVRVQAFQEAARGNLIPCGWKPGDKTL